MNYYVLVCDYGDSKYVVGVICDKETAVNTCNELNKDSKTTTYYLEELDEDYFPLFGKGK